MDAKSRGLCDVTEMGADAAVTQQCRFVKPETARLMAASSYCRGLEQTCPELADRSSVAIWPQLAGLQTEEQVKA